MPDNARTVADAISLLRDRLNLRQTDVAARCVLSPAEVSHLESGRNRASSARVRKALAQAFGIPRTFLERYLDGEVELLETLAAMAEDWPPRDDVLEAVLLVHGPNRRWSRSAVEAVRSMHTAAERAPNDWVALLDEAEAAVGDIARRRGFNLVRRTPHTEFHKAEVERLSKLRK